MSARRDGTVRSPGWSQWPCPPVGSSCDATAEPSGAQSADHGHQLRGREPGVMRRARQGCRSVAGRTSTHARTVVETTVRAPVPVVPAQADETVEALVRLAVRGTSRAPQRGPGSGRRARAVAAWRRSSCLKPSAPRYGPKLRPSAAGNQGGKRPTPSQSHWRTRGAD